MIDEVSSQPLGPSGIASRMAEIQSRMDSVLGTHAMATPSFSSALAGQLSGTIGGGNQPMSPFGGGMGMESSVSPELKSMIQQAANKNGVDPDLLDALVKQESGYSTTARSKVGAMGLTQLMPHTAQALGVSNAFDPAQNLDGGARYLKEQLNRFGDVSSALAAYNAGPGAVLKHGGIPPFPETQAYVRNIMNHVGRAKAITHG